MRESDENRNLLGRTVFRLLAWFAFIVAVVGLTVRFAPVVNHLELVVVALSPYLMFAAVLAFGLLWHTGDRRWAALALIPLAVGAGLKVPAFVRESHADGATIPIRVLTANVHDGAGEPASIAAAARAHADVVLLQELDPDQAAALLAHPGLSGDFPYSALDARPHAAGVGILSRYPIVQRSRISGYQLGATTATLRPAGAESDVLVATVHLAGPWPQPIDRWRSEIDSFPETLERLRRTAGRGAAIVGGDFNATTDFRPFRRLLDTGFADAIEQSGGGLGRTFPANSWLPPLIGIDHILAYNGWAAESGQVRIAGTDHLGVTATINVAAKG